MIDLATVHLLSNVPAELLGLQAANKLLTAQNSTLISKNNNLQIGLWILGGVTVIGSIYLIMKMIAESEKQNTIIKRPEPNKSVPEGPSVKNNTLTNKPTI